MAAGSLFYRASFVLLYIHKQGQQVRDVGGCCRCSCLLPEETAGIAGRALVATVSSLTRSEPNALSGNSWQSTRT